MNNEIDIILSRYFSGEATQKELCTLDNWLVKSEENEKYFHQMTLLYQSVGQENIFLSIDTGKALAKFKNHIYKKQKKNDSFSLKVSTIWKIAAAVALLVVGTFAVFHFVNQSSETVHLMAIETSKEHTLFGNTNVTLFPNSEIIYNPQLKQMVQLNGKAMFTIDSETSEGIVVQAGETFIKDIGTAFTVDASRSNKFITVDVSEGEVWFYTDTDKGIYVKQDESAIYDVQTKQFTMAAETQVKTQCVASLQQDIVFQNTPLYEAVNILKTRYKVDIVIHSNTLNDISLNASFDKNESIENVLAIITETITAHLSKKDSIYIITVNQ